MKSSKLKIPFLLIPLIATLSAPLAFSAPPAGHPRVSTMDITLFELIAADIAAHRGDADFACDAWFDVAQRKQSAEAAELAWQAAVTSRNSKRMQQTAELWLKLDPTAESAHLTLLANAVATNATDKIRSEVKILAANATNKESGDARGDWLLRLLNTLNHPSRGEPGLHTLVTTLTPEVTKYRLRADIRVSYARLLLAAGQGDEACREASTAVAKTTSSELLGRAADVCWPVSSDETRKMVTNYLSKHPNDVFARLLLGRIELKLGRRAQALQALQAATKRPLSDARLAASAGELALDLNDAVTAEKYLSRYIEIVREETESADLSHLEVWLQLGNAALMQNASERAAEYYAQLTGGPFALQARIREALALADAGLAEKALDVLRRAKKTLHDEAPALCNAELRLLLELGRDEEALRVATESIAAFPKDPDLLYETAMIEENHGLHEAAEEHLRALIAIQPSHVQGCNALGYLLADDSRNLSEARTLLERAYAASPLDPYVLDSMGWLCYREGRLKAAAEFVLSSLKRLWETDVAEHLVEILAVSGRNEEAEKVLVEMLRHEEQEAAQALATRFGLKLPREMAQ